MSQIFSCSLCLHYREISKLRKRQCGQWLTWQLGAMFNRWVLLWQLLDHVICSLGQVCKLIEAGVIKPLCDLLTIKDAKVSITVLSHYIMWSPTDHISNAGCHSKHVIGELMWHHVMHYSDHCITDCSQDELQGATVFVGRGGWRWDIVSVHCA